MQFEKLGKNISAFTSTSSDIDAVSAALENLSLDYVKVALSMGDFNDEEKVWYLMCKGLTEEQARASVANLSAAASTDVLTAAMARAKVAAKGLWATMLAHPYLSIAAAAATAIAAIVTVKKKIEEAQAAAREAATEDYNGYKETAESIESYKTKIAELKTALDEGNLSEEEAYEKRKELLSIRDEMCEALGMEADAFDILHDSIVDVNDALDNYNVIEASATLTKNKDTYDDAVDAMTKLNTYYGFIANKAALSTDEAADALERVKEIFADIFGYDALQDNNAGYFTYDIQLNATDAKQKFGELSLALSNLDAELAESGTSLYELFDIDYTTQLTNSLDEAQGVLDKFSDNYNEYITLTLVVNSDYSGIYTGIKNAKEAIEDAIANDDYDAFAQAWTSLTDLSDSVEDIDDDTIKEYLQGVVDAIETTAESMNLRIQLKTDLEVDDSDIKDILSKFADEDGTITTETISIVGQKVENNIDTAGLGEQADAYERLQEVADGYGATVSDLVDGLVELGYVTGNTTEETIDFSASISELSDTLTSLKTEQSALADAMSEQYSAAFWYVIPIPNALFALPLNP